MIARDYFARQATTLLRMAKWVKDPQAHAALATKAAEMHERLVEPGDQDQVQFKLENDNAA